MNTFSIPERGPRDTGLLPRSIKFSKGSGSWMAFSILIFALGLIVGISVIIPPHEGGLIAFKLSALLLCSLIGWLGYRSYRKTIQKRKAAFVNGTIVKGVVSHHGRSMNPFRSKFNYSVSISFANESGKVLREKVVSPSESIKADMPINSEVMMLLDKETGGCFIAELWGYRVLLS